MTSENTNIAKSFISWPFGVLICLFVILLAVIVCAAAVVAAIMWPLLVMLGLVSGEKKKA